MTGSPSLSPLPPAAHPKGRAARVLLSSVFGPYARDDEYGGRRQNPMELYHNQVTREEGPFSLRMHHRSFGLMLLQANIDAPCTLLDFPSLERFREELVRHPYDVVGIGAIVPNLGKVRAMCALARELRPEATIVVGGHVAAKPDLEALVDADHIVRGEGVRWLRAYLGQDPDAPVRHPVVLAGFASQTMGVAIPSGPRDTAAVLLPSVGCPMGCNFCSTSAMFGGKGNFVSFYESGDELYEVMCGIEAALGVRSFFALDENFLLHRQRALRLLELMERDGKSWSLYVFSSARVLDKYTLEQLVGLGVSWVWMGLEGEASQYRKLRGVDTLELVPRLQAHGIRVLGSTIIGLEEHTPHNIERVIARATAHASDFHQFMLYTPNPGTPLYEEHLAAGTLLSDAECSPADAHGQLRFKHRHPHIPPGQETELLARAFRADLARNGPGIFRQMRTLLQGWRRYKDHPSPRVRARVARESTSLATTHAGALWAAQRWFARRGQPGVAEQLRALLADVQQEFGWRARLSAPILGRAMELALARQERRMAAGWSSEPETFCELNPAAVALGHPTGRPAVPWVQCASPARTDAAWR